jgi:ATP-binding cassette subfamily B protein RaxB
VLQGVDLHIAKAGEPVVHRPLGLRQDHAGDLLLGVLTLTAVRSARGELQTLGLDTLRSMVGTVLQDRMLPAGSIADNIAFFDPQSTRPC